MSMEILSRRVMTALSLTLLHVSRGAPTAGRCVGTEKRKTREPLDRRAVEKQYLREIELADRNAVLPASKYYATSCGKAKIFEKKN